MKQTVDKSSFIEAFRAYNRYDQFGGEALGVLFDYLEGYEEDCGQELELDVIALCCDFSADTVEDIASNYSIDLSECEDDEAKREAVQEYLMDNTSVCGETSDGQFVYCSAF